MKATKIGWIGLGKMGVPMSQNLVKAGYPVAVYNRSKDKEEILKKQGVATAATPAALIEVSEVVVIMVTDDKAIREIFTGDQGLLSAKSTGRILINMSTVSPAISREMAALCGRQGHHYLDAPVSGSVKQADDGQLVIMAGGDPAIFEKAKPILENLGKMAMLVGDTGAGNAAKLAINSLLSLYALGLAETLLFAKQNGTGIGDLMTLINNSALSNVFSKIKGEAVINDNYQPAFSLNNILKDLLLAKDLGLATPLSGVVLNTFREAAPAHGEEDIIAVIKQVDPAQ